MSPHERGRIVWKLGELIQQNLDEMARLESLCTGKTLFDSGKVEIPFAAEVFRYYAGWASKIHGETLQLRENAFTFTLRHPVGVVGAIVPWNFPFLLSSWKIAPALAAGEHDGAQAGLADSAHRAQVRRALPAGGSARGRAQRRDGPGRQGRHGPGARPAGGQDRLHGLDGRGQADHARGGRDAEAALARAGGKSNIVFADADMEAAVRRP